MPLWPSTRKTSSPPRKPISGGLDPENFPRRVQGCAENSVDCWGIAVSWVLSKRSDPICWCWLRIIVHVEWGHFNGLISSKVELKQTAWCLQRIHRMSGAPWVGCKSGDHFECVNFATVCLSRFMIKETLGEVDLAVVKHSKDLARSKKAQNSACFLQFRVLSEKVCKTT